MTDLVDEILTAKPIDAATVVLVRQAPDDYGIQTLLLCRGKSRTVMNNAWVFPGGKVDAADLNHSSTIQNQLAGSAADMLNEPDLDNHSACALFRAACRETQEETGVSLQPAALQTWSRWITPNEPSMMKKRFDARFFIASMPEGQTATHDGQEATDSQWCSPSYALRQYAANTLVLAAPQIMTLIALCQYNNVDDVLEAAYNTPSYHIRPQVIKTGQSRTLIYPGDVNHPESEKKMPGPTRLTWKDTHFEPPQGLEQFYQ